MIRTGRVFFLLLMMMATGMTSVRAQEATSPPASEIGWTGVDHALQLASAGDKLVLIFVYAEWCPYCHRMWEEVWPDERVGEQVRRYFVPVPINIDSDDPVHFQGHTFTESEFSRALQNESVPTVYFMNTNGEIVGRQPGFLPAELFARLLEYVGSGAYETQTFDEFDSGNP